MDFQTAKVGFFAIFRSFYHNFINIHNYGISHFKDVNATSKVPTMVLAMSRQEIVSVLLDTLEIPVKKEKSRKVNLNATVNLNTKSVVIIFPFIKTAITTSLLAD